MDQQPRRALPGMAASVTAQPGVQGELSSPPVPARRHFHKHRDPAAGPGYWKRSGMLGCCGVPGMLGALRDVGMLGALRDVGMLRSAPECQECPGSAPGRWEPSGTLGCWERAGMPRVPREPAGTLRSARDWGAAARSEGSSGLGRSAAREDTKERLGTPRSCGAHVRGRAGAAFVPGCPQAIAQRAGCQPRAPRGISINHQPSTINPAGHRGAFPSTTNPAGPAGSDTRSSPRAGAAPEGAQRGREQRGVLPNDTLHL